MNKFDQVITRYRQVERWTAAGAVALGFFLAGAAWKSQGDTATPVIDGENIGTALVDCTMTVPITVQPGDTIIAIADRHGVEDPYNPYDRINFDIKRTVAGGETTTIPIERFDAKSLRPDTDRVIMTDLSHMCVIAANDFARSQS